LIFGDADGFAIFTRFSGVCFIAFFVFEDFIAKNNELDIFIGKVGIPFREYGL